MNNKVLELNNKLKGKKIAIIGAGVSNLPLIEYMAKLSDKVVLFDMKELSDDARQLVEKYNIKTSLGDNELR